MQRSRLTRARLDGIVLDLEFLLIAVIQGLALTTLAVESEAVIGEGEWIYWPYMVSGFIIVVSFWTLATIHSISFIAWPFDVVHTILYMLVAFVEVAAFAQITHPERWFVFTFVFFLASAVLYGWDMRMIIEHRGEYADTPARARLWEHSHSRQLTELRLVLPGALAFQAMVVIVLWVSPETVMADNRHLWLVGAQVVFGLLYLSDTLRTFRTRRELITACIEDGAAEH
jgi:hypothetical protein